MIPWDEFWGVMLQVGIGVGLMLLLTVLCIIATIWYVERRW